jgi:hypothetical protein
MTSTPAANAADLDAELAEIARVAFLLGLTDGRVRAEPLSNGKLMARLGKCVPRLLHTRRVWQVYVAAFEIGAMQRRITAASRPKEGIW